VRARVCKCYRTGRGGVRRVVCCRNSAVWSLRKYPSQGPERPPCHHPNPPRPGLPITNINLSPCRPNPAASLPFPSPIRSSGPSIASPSPPSTHSRPAPSFPPRSPSHPPSRFIRPSSTLALFRAVPFPLVPSHRSLACFPRRRPARRRLVPPRSARTAKEEKNSSPTELPRGCASQAPRAAPPKAAATHGRCQNGCLRERVLLVFGFKLGIAEAREIQELRGLIKHHRLAQAALRMRGIKEHAMPRSRVPAETHLHAA
jgi:hypothetical protein